MDDARIGRALRELRRRRGLRQVDVAATAGVSQQTVSLIECGQAAAFTIDTVRRVFAALGASYEGSILWRGGALDRLLDARHAVLVEAMAHHLGNLGWRVIVEATYSIYGERGSIDILAGDSRTRTALVVEVKSTLESIEALGRKTDEKVRLARRHLGRERFGWTPAAIGRLLVLPGTDAARSAVARNAAILGRMFAWKANLVRSWLREPRGDMSGVLFIADTNAVGGNRAGRGSQRVRPPRTPSPKLVNASEGNAGALRAIPPAVTTNPIGKSG